MVEMTYRGPMGESISPGPFDAPQALPQATQNAGNSSYVFPTGSEGGGLSPVSVLIGLILLLWGMKFIGEHDKSEISPAHIHIGGYNLVVLSVASIISIVGAKVVFNTVHVPGVTDIVNAA